MHTERWNDVDEIFGAALELAAAERAAFLARACDGNETLRVEVESLLAAHGAAGDFIQAPVFDTGVNLLAQRGQKPTGQAERLIGAYEVIRLLGEGGMGEVYLAARADHTFTKHVAIKLLRRDAENREIARRFRTERQILAALDHPNIARLLDGGSTVEGHPYLVMEYVEGQPLNDYCAKWQLDLRARLELFLQVCAAVQYAHQHLVIHRDLKPSNILVTTSQDGKGGKLKLLDFGIAKLLAPEAGPSGAELLTRAETTQGLRLMTPAYASPEQVQGGNITTATDVYALGVLLYELLTGQRPFQAKTDSLPDLLKAVIEEEPAPPSATAERAKDESRRMNEKPGAQRFPLSFIIPPSLLRGDLDNIILMALRKEPQRRYASVEQLAEDLRRFLAGMPITARKPTLTYRAQKFVLRNKAMTVVAALLVMSLLGGIIGINQQRRRAERRFNEVRKLAHAVVFELHDGIEKLPGSTPVRALLVQRSIEYLDSLAQEATNDVSLQRELAEAYERIGAIQGNPYSANLGDGDGSLKSYRRALALREAVLTKQPQDVAARVELATALMKASGIVEFTEGRDAALQMNQRALQLCTTLAEQQSQDPVVRSCLASAHEGLGDELEGKQDFASALQHYRQYFLLVEGLFNETILPAEKAEYQRLKAISLKKLSKAEEDLGDANTSLATAQQALQEYLMLAQADPQNPKAQLELAWAHMVVGNDFWDAKDLPNALSHYQRARQLEETIVQNDPQNMQMLVALAQSTNSVGYVLAQQGDATGARQRCDKALTILETMLQTTPTPPHAVRAATELYGYDAEVRVILATRRGIAVAESHIYWQAALKSYQRSLVLLRQLKEKGLASPAELQKESLLLNAIAKCQNRVG